MPIPIIAMNTATMILAQAVDVSLCKSLTLDLLTEGGQLAHVLVRPWQTEQKTNDQTGDSEHDRACPMVCQGVHGDSESQDVRTTDEDKDEDRAQSHDLSSNTPSDELSAIRERLHLRERKFKLADKPPSVSCNHTEEADAQ
jgi:hypothetical protein